MRSVHLGRLARLMFGRVLWPVGALAVGGLFLALVVSGLPQEAVDAAFGGLAARGVIAGYDREHPGLAARLAAEPDYRRFLITSLALYGLVALVILHQVVLALTQRSRAVFVSGDMRRFRWLLLGLAVISTGVAYLMQDPLYSGRSGIVGPGPLGQGRLALVFAGLLMLVAAWRAYLLVTGKLTGTLPMERWPTQPWMTRFPTEQAGRG